MTATTATTRALSLPTPARARRRTCLPTSPTACPATASRRPSASRPTAPTGAQGAKVYLRAEIDGDTSAKEGTAIKYDDVLSHIHMTVSQDGKVLATNKNASLFDQLDAADGLKSDVLVAEVFPKADPIKLDVTVEIDPAMGNAFQEAAAHIKFVFSAEDNELPPPPLERDNHDSYIAGYPDCTVAPADRSRAPRSPRSSTAS